MCFMWTRTIWHTTTKKKKRRKENVALYVGMYRAARSTRSRVHFYSARHHIVTVFISFIHKKHFINLFRINFHFILWPKRLNEQRINCFFFFSDIIGQPKNTIDGSVGRSVGRHRCHCRLFVNVVVVRFCSQTR